jgi:hypothetical protein
LTDDLRLNMWKGMVNKLAGHCYVASEAFFHLAGGLENWKVYRIKHDGTSHWFLKNRHEGYVVDLTAEQFDTPVEYEKATATGFLTIRPSRRAERVMQCVREGGWPS